jgi:hypothetical protein
MPISGLTTGLFFAVHVAGPAWDHDKGKLIPTDLPYEQKHIEQSTGNSTVPLTGVGHLSVMQVSTASSTIQSSASAGFSQWPKV